MRTARAAALIQAAIAAHAFPCAVIEGGRRSGPQWRQAFGRLAYPPDAPATTDRTIFDLASITKPIATTTLVMRAVAAGRLSIDGRVAEFLKDWRGRDRESVTIRDLLEHASGLTSYLPFFRDHRGRQEFERAICTLPLECAPRTQSIYSDLGFMLLGFILEDVTRRSLAEQFEEVAREIDLEDLRFNPPREWCDRTAPTELDLWRGRLLQGEVHDENAWALGGAAGHTGLFGSAIAVGAFARAMLGTLQGVGTLAKPATLAAFIQRSDVPGSARALGWEIASPSASYGTRVSTRAIGHTGFTGTSLLIDPEQDLYVVFLTNRVHPARDNDAIRAVRPRVHDEIMDA
jgi:CubicO group peptidase (beta-lactamase class C family)